MLLAAGVDPGEQRKLEKLKQNISTATTFKSVADDYQDKREGRARATLGKTEWLLSLVLQKLGGRANKPDYCA